MQNIYTTFRVPILVFVIRLFDDFDNRHLLFMIFYFIVKV